MKLEYDLTKRYDRWDETQQILKCAASRQQRTQQQQQRVAASALADASPLASSSSSKIVCWTLDVFDPRYVISLRLVVWTLIVALIHTVTVLTLVPLYATLPNAISPYIFLSVLLAEFPVVLYHYLLFLHEKKHLDPRRVYDFRAMDYVIFSSILLGLVGFILIESFKKSPRAIAVLYAVLFMPVLVVLGFVLYGFMDLWRYFRRRRKETPKRSP